MTIKKGQRITVTYEDRKSEVIVIDPDGLGKGQPPNTTSKRNTR